MSNEQQIINENLTKDNEYGFVTDIESETLPPGLDENVIRTISAKKEEPSWFFFFSGNGANYVFINTGRVGF